MAEGFGRFWPREHAQFLRIAKSSLMETHSSARTGFNRGYFSATDTDRMQRLCGRSGKAATKLILFGVSRATSRVSREQSSQTANVNLWNLWNLWNPWNLWNLWNL